MRYQWPTLESKENSYQSHCMEKLSELCLNENQNRVAYINDSIGLHRVENRSAESYAVSLHLYCPPFDHCHTFDETTGLNKQVNVVFDTQHTLTVPTFTVSKRKVSKETGIKDVLFFEESNLITTAGMPKHNDKTR